jgi:hypothetical protein
MLSWLSTRFRFKAALALAALYAFCVLAPHAAFALADADAAAHCLNEQRGHAHQPKAAEKHVHADGTTHEHPKSSAAHDDANGDGKGTSTNCCGLFCLTALANAMPPLISAPLLSTVVEASADRGLPSRAPDRINRPPIA